MADALRAAVLADGLLLSPDADRRVIVELRGAPAAPVVSPPADMWMRRVLESTPGGRGGERDGALVVRLDVAASDPLAVHQIAAVARAACADSLADREPRRIAPATLARWSRRPGSVPDAAAPADEGDGRWLWLAVLGLLAVEHLMRRRSAAARAAVGRVEGDVRVA
jgi:hypothetical protein